MLQPTFEENRAALTLNHRNTDTQPYNIQSTGVVDREFVENILKIGDVSFALYGTWEALGACKILPWGVGTIFRRFGPISEFAKNITCYGYICFDGISHFLYV